MILSAFKTYVKLDFKRTDKDTEIIQAYNDMIMWVAAQMPHAGYKYQSYVNTVAGTEDYALPCDLLHLIHPIRFLLGSGSSDEGYPMDMIGKTRYNEIEPNPNRTNPSARGRPTKYTVYSRSILVTPIPDASTYLFEIDWTKRPGDLSTDAQSPDLGKSWEEVLKQGTLERLYAGLGLYDEAQYWGSQYHQMQNGIDTPVGLCHKLYAIEKDREEVAIGQVKFNNL